MSEETAPVEQTELKSIMGDYEEWLSGREDAHPQTFKYVEEEGGGLYEVKLEESDSTVDVYLGEIDEDFYGEKVGLFVESSLGLPDPSLDFTKLLAFFSELPLLCRLTLRTDEEPELVVEAALPWNTIEFDMVQLLIREVATIADEMKGFLSGKAR